MRKNILTVLLFLFVFSAVYGQNNTPIDLLLLLDTSSPMSSSYNNVNGYITGSFLSEFLREGDTFHLIPFSGSPRLDAARRINGIGDVETIIGRMLLQYPVESGSNIGAAITFAERYIASLPARPKKIVIVSGGGTDTNNLVSAAKQRLGSNTTIDFVQVRAGSPLSNLPRSGRPAMTRTTPSSQQSVSQRPAVSAAPSAPASPAAVSQTGSQRTDSSQTDSSRTDSSSQTASGSGTPAQTQSTGTAQGAGSQTQDTGSTQAASQTQDTGSTQSTARDTSSSSAGQAASGTSAQQAVTDDKTPAGSSDSKPASRSSQQTQKSRAGSEQAASSLPFIILIVILVLLALGLIIFFASRRLGSSPNRVMAQVASSGAEPAEAPFVDHSNDLAKYAAAQNRQRTTPYDNKPAKKETEKPVAINPSGPLLLNLFVEDQNTAIGKRNIHSLKSGYSLSVGGGNSDFLIFLVPVPSNLGEIRRDGSHCTFIPHKPKYFPDLGSNELKDCINKTIRIVSDKNYEMRFRFVMYEDPLIALNRVLMSIKVPG